MTTKKRNHYRSLITFQVVASYMVRGVVHHIGGSQFKANSAVEAKKVAARMYIDLQSEFGVHLKLDLFMVAPDGNSIGLVKTYK